LTIKLTQTVDAMSIDVPSRAAVNRLCEISLAWACATLLLMMSG